MSKTPEELKAEMVTANKAVRMAYDVWAVAYPEEEDEALAAIDKADAAYNAARNDYYEALKGGAS